MLGCQPHRPRCFDLLGGQARLGEVTENDALFDLAELIAEHPRARLRTNQKRQTLLAGVGISRLAGREGLHRRSGPTI